MKAYKALVVNEYRKRYAVPSINKKDTGDIIRELADNDEMFENLVFELGLRTLRKELLKQDLCRLEG